MLHNYYIIRQVAGEIRERCTGLAFVRAYSIFPHELCIELGDHDRSELIVAKLAPGNAVLYLSSEAHTPPKRNVTNFFRELEAKILTDVSIARYDRIVRLCFSDEHALVLRFFDKPNAFSFIGSVFTSSFKKTENVPTFSSENGEFDLHRSLLLLSAPLRKEFSARNTSPEKFETELRNSKVTYAYIGLISPVRLTSLDQAPEELLSASEAVEQATRERERTKAIEGRRRVLLASIDHFIDRTNSARSEAENAIADSSRSERHSLIAQEILALAQDIPKGATSCVVLVDGNETKIDLDPTLTPYENANRYFDKARTAKARKSDVAKRIRSLAADETTLYTIRARIAEAGSQKDLDRIQKDISASRFTLRETTEALGEAGPRFREFEVAGGMRVFVGKNAKQNDELTLHFAHKEDLWFHARHVTGSHVVLRSGKLANIPQRAIEQAAELAAYFSDARTQAHAPVAYTRRKYVRKPRGAAPGAVKIDKEEVIIVTPQISANPITP